MCLCKIILGLAEHRDQSSDTKYLLHNKYLGMPKTERAPWHDKALVIRPYALPGFFVWGMEKRFSYAEKLKNSILTTFFNWLFENQGIQFASCYKRPSWCGNKEHRRCLHWFVWSSEAIWHCKLKLRKAGPLGSKGE